nr:RsmE family RNA methyltransferase [Salsipaludibacter albus]
MADAVPGSVVALDDDQHHHLVRVRRHRDGTEVTASDGTGREVAAVRDGHSLVVRSVTDRPARGPVLEVWQALGKQRKHDEVVRMLTEAGVDAVTAVTTRRTQVDLSGKAERVRERWRSVADAACTQSRRSHRPRVEGPVELAELVADLASSAPTSTDAGTCVLVADPSSERSPLDALPADLPERIVLVVGPEGGLAEDEVADLVAVGATGVTLGPTVLRTEHAGLVLAGVVAAGTGRMSAR